MVRNSRLSLSRRFLSCSSFSIRLKSCNCLISCPLRLSSSLVRAFCSASSSRRRRTRICSSLGPAYATHSPPRHTLPGRQSEFVRHRTPVVAQIHLHFSSRVMPGGQEGGSLHTLFTHFPHGPQSASVEHCASASAQQSSAGAMKRAIVNRETANSDTCAFLFISTILIRLRALARGSPDSRSQPSRKIVEAERPACSGRLSGAFGFPVKPDPFIVHRRK